MNFSTFRRGLALSLARNNALVLRVPRHSSTVVLAYIPKNQCNSTLVQLNRRYCSYPSNSGKGGADGGGSDGYKEVGGVRETALVEKEDYDKMLSPIHVPNFVPEVPIIAINRFPLFPGFGKRVQIVKDDALKDLLRRKVKCKQPYVGVFVKKDDNDDSESVSSIGKLYTVGSFATITDFHDHGEHLVMGISAHRRIRILEQINEKSESTPSSTTTQMSKLNGRRTKTRNKDAEKVDSATSKTTEESAGNTNVIFARTENIITAQFERTNEIKASMSAIVQAIRDIVNYSPFIGQQINLMLSPATEVLDNPVFLCDLVAAISINAQTEDLQQMMEESDIIRRLDIALTLLEKEKTILKIREKISKEVEKNVSTQHRKYLLQEQLKAIKKELGIEKDDKTTINEKIDEKMKGLNIPEYALKVIKEEQTKLGFLDPHSSEFSVVRNYLDWLLAVPWGKTSEGNVDLKRAAEILDEDHYGMKDVKNRILEFIAVSILKNSTGGKILCFHGPPGVGKTSIAKSIARVLNRKYFRFSVGGMTDVAEIKGHRRTYVGAMPGKMIQCLKKVETENPLVLIDEIDKISGPGHHGDPASALLELLDPEQNSNFMDHFLDVPVDLSKVLFICTANVVDTIPAALADRMELIEVSGYVAEEKVKIAERYLIPKCREDCALPEDKLLIQPTAIENIIKSYCRESGVRNLQKHIEKIFRKAAFKIAGGVETTEEEGSTSEVVSNSPPSEDVAAIVVDNNNLSKFLGRGKFTTDRLYEVTPPGIIMGLAWTSMGGSALYIETSLSRRYKAHGTVINVGSDEVKEGKGEEVGSLETTGHLGDVMKESTRTAYTVAKNSLIKRREDNDLLEKAHIHLHVPEGATPKDGPSAGVTITSALISLALNKAAKQNVAMTGEISLTGKVLPVGGIREKVIAAKRAGVTEVIMPAENRKDFEDLPNFIKENVHVYFVSHYDEVFDILF